MRTVSQTYGQFMWNRQNNPLARNFWKDNVCAPLFEEYNYTCQRCGCYLPPGKYVDGQFLCAHHKSYYDPITKQNIVGFEHLHLDLMIPLCNGPKSNRCHDWVHGKLWYQRGKVPKSEFFFHG